MPPHHLEAIIIPSLSRLLSQTVHHLISITPVLSQHMYVAHPNASTAGNFLMMAFFLAILITPSARVTVTQMGRPSGMAATARETPDGL